MFSSALFVIEIFIAEFLITLRLKRKSHFALRFFGVLVVVLALAIAIPVIDNIWYNFFIYILLFAFTIIGLKIIHDEPWINVIFCGVAAYTTQHFAYQFVNLLFTLILWGESPLFGMYHVAEVNVSQLNLETLFWSAIYVMGYFTVYVLVWFLFARRIRIDAELKIRNHAFLVLIGGCLLLNILLNALVVFSNDKLAVLTAVVLQIASVFNCLLLLQWQFELVNSNRLEMELEVTEKLLSKAKEQYNISKENIDLINLKCHDIKHQIREIGSYKQLDEDTIKDLEKAVSVYDSAVKTENEALDVILTEKSFKCLRNNITLSCIADGKALHFIKKSDIYSLFGNVLDNAMEAVMKLHEEAKRAIGLKVYSVGEFITINVRNFYQGEIIFNSNGYPDTTKTNNGYHGYGMRSILLIVKKYNGDISIKAEKGIFNLNILIPIPND